MTALDPALLPWIDALARQVAQDYLTAEAAPEAADAAQRPNPVPLLDLDNAA
jgi:hypothetical protein